MALKIIRERQTITQTRHVLAFDWLSNGVSTGGGFSFECDADGNVDMERLREPFREAALANYLACKDKSIKPPQAYPHYTIGTGYVRTNSWTVQSPTIVECEACGEEAEMSGCGVFVCNTCNHHHGIVRCYCGWSANGGDGRAELIELGETIDGE